MTRDTRALVGVRATVIPDTWEAHHQPTVNRTFTAEGALVKDRVWVWDPETEKEIRVAGPTIYSGPLRFQHLREPRETTAGGQDVTTQVYQVSVPEEVDDVESIAWVQILASSDASATWLKVTGIIRGSLRWQRDLICTDNIG